MTLRQDVNSSYFEGIDSGVTGNFDDRSVVGRCQFRGIGIMPQWRGSTSSYSVYNGTIQIEDVNAAGNDGSGTVLFEMPVVAQNGYPVSSFFTFADDDGYILFEKGMFLTDTTTSGTAPLLNFAVILFYGT